MRNLFFFLSALFTLSCQGIEIIDPERETSVATACGVADPLKDLPWLETAIQKATEPDDGLYCSLWQVTQGSYQGKTVFIAQVTGALCCTCGNVVYNCDGEAAFVCDYEKEAAISNKQVIWKKI